MPIIKNIENTKLLKPHWLPSLPSSLYRSLEKRAANWIFILVLNCIQSELLSLASGSGSHWFGFHRYLQRRWKVKSHVWIVACHQSKHTTRIFGILGENWETSFTWKVIENCQRPVKVFKWQENDKDHQSFLLSFLFLAHLGDLCPVNVITA